MTNNKQPIGCLLVHGFTSFPDSLEAIIPALKHRDLPYEFPLLTGHGTKPEKLAGVTWQQWQQDVRASMTSLCQRAKHIVVIGFSMGSLLALELASQFPDIVSGLVLLSPCLHFAIPLTKYTSELSKYIKRVPDIQILRFSKPTLALKNKKYFWFPSDAFLHYWQRTKHFDAILETVHQPTMIIHSKNDKIAATSGAEHIYNIIPATDKKIIWLKKSGHELLLDVETDTVLKHILSFPQLQ